jgi:hypothetical protein
MPEWAQAQSWGWITRTGQLTGTGHRHAGPLTKGSFTTDELMLPHIPRLRFCVYLRESASNPRV